MLGRREEVNELQRVNSVMECDVRTTERKEMNMRKVGKVCVALFLGTLFYGCGHTTVSRVGLLSLGDLESRTIPSVVDGPIVFGEDRCKLGGDSYYLSEAVRNALVGTEYDTIVDAEVTTKTGLFVWSNKIEVKGKGINSETLPKEGVAR